MSQGSEKGHYRELETTTEGLSLDLVAIRRLLTLAGHTGGLAEARSILRDTINLPGLPPDRRAAYEALITEMEGLEEAASRRILRSQETPLR